MMHRPDDPPSPMKLTVGAREHFTDSELVAIARNSVSAQVLALRVSDATKARLTERSEAFFAALDEALLEHFRNGGADLPPSA